MNWCLYMMVADAGDGSRYCKIGFTGDLDKRVRAVQTGCPMPITEVAYLDLAFGRLRLAESQFHSKLAKYRSSGEWFRLDFNNPDHKADFSRATDEVIAWSGSTGTKWKTMELGAVRLLSRALRLDKVA